VSENIQPASEENKIVEGFEKEKLSENNPLELMLNNLLLI